ncbi:MAG: HipA family kinase, partial [Thermoanaerobaculia bacterium]
MPRAVEHIRRMRGGAQAHLMRCDDAFYYVVKFQNNPQHPRILVNEYMGTRLAARLGLPTPHTAVVEVPQSLIEYTTELVVQLGA